MDQSGRQQTIGARVHDTEARLVDAAARLEGVTRSDLVRAATLRFARERLAREAEEPVEEELAEAI